MQIKDLPTELLLQIFHSTPTLSTLHALTTTCTHFHSILRSHLLPTLYAVVAQQYGPLPPAILICTHNATQLPHLPRPAPPQSFALLKRVVEVGKVAQQWVDVYPAMKWRGEKSSDRRFLTAEEEWRLRRACYRLWLYTLAFHTSSYARHSRLQPQIIRTRALLLRPWPTQQLAEMLDLHDILRQVLDSHVCPSNGTVLKRHKARYPDDPFPLVSTKTIRNFCDPEQLARDFDHAVLFGTTNGSKLSHRTGNHNTERYGIAVAGWGDEISQYYVVEDMLKCDPGQLMHLFQAVTGQVGTEAGSGMEAFGAKSVVESFVASLGDWFDNNGETLCETAGVVVGDRGGDVGLLRDGIEEDWEGIARGEDE